MIKPHLGWVLTSVFLSAGVAFAAIGQAEWHAYRSDLIRCADAETRGNKACGTPVVGSDPLSSGRVVMSERSITGTLHGAAANTTYTLIFIPLTNTGSNALGPYSGGFDKIGNIVTNRNGNGSATFGTGVIPNPTLGYFLVNKADTTNEFVTGFDPATPSPSPTITES